jgi:hypothetical protein
MSNAHPVTRLPLRPCVTFVLRCVGRTLVRTQAKLVDAINLTILPYVRCALLTLGLVDPIRPPRC